MDAAPLQIRQGLWPARQLPAIEPDRLLQGRSLVFDRTQPHRGLAEGKPFPQLHQTDQIAAAPAAMAIENVLAAVDVERRLGLPMERTESRHFGASAAPQHFPASLFQVIKQRNALPESVGKVFSHPGFASGIRIRRPAVKSQARMVGGRRILTFSQHSSDPNRRWNQRRNVEASGVRSGSRSVGAACSTGRPSQQASALCWRVGKPYCVPGRDQAGSTVQVRPQPAHSPRRTRMLDRRSSCADFSRRPCPTTAPPQTGQILGSHSQSGSSNPGLHNGSVRGITTIILARRPG